MSLSKKRQRMPNNSNNATTTSSLPVPVTPSANLLPSWACPLAWEPSARTRLSRAVPDYISTKAHAQFFARGTGGSFIPLNKTQICYEARQLSLADWDNLASQDVPEHTGESCRQQWLNNLAPDLIDGGGVGCQVEGTELGDTTREGSTKKSKRGQPEKHPLIAFSRCEIAALKRAAVKYEGRNWIAIAKDVNDARIRDVAMNGSIANNTEMYRTAFRCFTEWKSMQKLVVGKRKKESKAHLVKWTAKEDVALRNAMNCYGAKFSHVALCVPGRTSKQCRDHWYKLNPDTSDGQSTKSAHFTRTERQRLMMAVRMYPPNAWKLISEHLPGRTPTQVRGKHKLMAASAAKATAETAAAAARKTAATAAVATPLSADPYT